jgi:hypothetical protein
MPFHPPGQSLLHTLERGRALPSPVVQLAQWRLIESLNKRGLGGIEIRSECLERKGTLVGCLLAFLARLRGAVALFGVFRPSICSGIGRLESRALIDQSIGTGTQLGKHNSPAFGFASQDL